MKRRQISLWWERRTKVSRATSSTSFFLGCVFPSQVAQNRPVFSSPILPVTTSLKQNKESESHVNILAFVFCTSCLVQGYPPDAMKLLRHFHILFSCTPTARWESNVSSVHENAKKLKMEVSVWHLNWLSRRYSVTARYSDRSYNWSLYLLTKIPSFFMLTLCCLGVKCWMKEQLSCSAKIQDLGLSILLSLQFNQQRENIIIKSNTGHVMLTLVQR